MKQKHLSHLEPRWQHHHALLRDPHEIVCQWQNAPQVDPELLRFDVRGRFWDIVEETGQTLIVTREYEHLVVALSVENGRPRVSYLHLPHPNGLAVDRRKRELFIASTRNPNMVYAFAPCDGEWSGFRNRKRKQPHGRPSLHPVAYAPGSTADNVGLLLPLRAQYLPGCLYLHDLACIDGELYANAVGLNAVVRLPEAGGFEPVWWPRCINAKSGPRFDRNYLQLNSIGAGPTLAASYFSASAERPFARRPGHLNFPVDRRGVIFSGATREVVCRGLTRPHSVRLQGGEIWVDNSGYGEVGRVASGQFEALARLPGWTRGLYFNGNKAFVGTSRVIPRFRHYAPGLMPEKCQTGVHILSLKSGAVLASLLWPNGNQIFAIEGMDRAWSHGFPFEYPERRSSSRTTALFSRGITLAAVCGVAGGRA
jgi:uncharacterized protein (TIGR03032 family)